MMLTMNFENYICKIASMEEMEHKWDYEIAQHSEKENWITWKSEAIESARAGKSIPYYGILDGTVICEATAVLNPDLGQACEKPEHTVELCAFRTNKEYRGKGCFSKLMAFLQKDLKQKGYRRAVVGVEPEEKHNREIYRHWGFTEDVGIGTETYPDGTTIQFDILGKLL
jgi:ribosomal protein S18 acetylase RimI-like enzyme